MKKIKLLVSVILLFAVILTSFVGCGDKATVDSGSGGGTAETGATSTETSLSNTAKLLKTEKKLTIGYIGGSITLGTSAKQYVSGSDLNKEANIKNSWVNRTSAYFAEQYPDATIETVNVGISNTQTNFGIYRLAKHLMNTDGHDMPDLVFIEFTSNDWNSGEELKIEIESLIRNIYAANPYAEIVVLSTNVNSASESRKLYREVCGEYKIPFVDVGTKLRGAIREKFGSTSENGPYFYTVDNLHPSAEGYKIYTDLIIETIEPLLKTELESDKLYNNFENLRAPLCSNLISNPKTIEATGLTFEGNTSKVSEPLNVSFHGTGLTVNTIPYVNEYILMNNGSKVSYTFTGNTFGVLVGFTKTGFTIRYRIDGGEWKTYSNVNSHLYVHTQVKILEHTLSEGTHTVEIEVQSDGFRLGAILINEK